LRYGAPSCSEADDLFRWRRHFNAYAAIFFLYAAIVRRRFIPGACPLWPVTGARRAALLRTCARRCAQCRHAFASVISSLLPLDDRRGRYIVVISEESMNGRASCVLPHRAPAQQKMVGGRRAVNLLAIVTVFTTAHARFTPPHARAGNRTIGGGVTIEHAAPRACVCQASVIAWKNKQSVGV
jgi:hypothetical protein